MAPLLSPSTKSIALGGAAARQVVEAGHGEAPAQAPAVEVGVDRDDVDLAQHGPSWLGVEQLRPAEAGQAPVDARGSRKPAGSNQGSAMRSSRCGAAHVALVGVVRRRPGG